MQLETISASAILRKKTEDLLIKKQPLDSLNPSEIEALNLIHELLVHHSEMDKHVAELTKAKNQAEDNFRKSDELLSEYVKYSPFLTYIKEVTPEESRILKVSKNYLDSVDNSDAELIGKTMKDIFPPELASKISADDWVVVSTGVMIQRDEEVNGRLYETIKYPIKLRDRTLVAGYTIDITEHKRIADDLRESEDKFKYIFENSLIGKSITLPSGEFNVNKAFCELLGYSSGELINTKWQDYTHPDDLALNNEIMRSILSGEKDSAFFTKRFIHKNGSIVWAEVITLLRRDNHGRPMYFMTSVNDITRRKQTETDLLEREEKYRSLFNNSEVGMFRTRLDGSEILEFNEMFLKILNYNHQELKGFPSVNIWADKSERDIMVKMLNAGGRVTDYECKLLTKQGDVRNCITSLRLYRETGILEGSMIDITERRLAEEALKENEEHIRSLYENAPIGIYRTTPEGKILLANPVLVKLFGKKSFEEFQSWNLMEENNFELQYSRKKFQKKIERDGKVKNLETKLIQKDGSVVFIRESAVLVHDKSGNPLYYDGTIEDITEQKLAEKALKESEEKYRKMVEHSPDAVIIHSSGKIVFVNPAAVHLFKSDNAQQIIDIPFIDFVHPEDKNTAIERIKHVYRNGKPAGFAEEKFVTLLCDTNHCQGHYLPKESGE